MTRFVTICVAQCFLVIAASAQKTKMADLPEPVRKTVQAQTQGVQIKAITKEKDGGQTIYEIETTVNGKVRDFLVDSTGALGEVEEETVLSAVPLAARTAVEKWAAGRKLSIVEKVTKGPAVTYEATIVKGGKEMSFRVKADGTVQK